MKTLFLTFILLLSTLGVASQQKASQTISINIWLQHLATLNWSEATPGVVFHIYRSTTSGFGYAIINLSPVTTLSYVDKMIASGTIYYYVVSAYDPVSNLESAYSSEVKAVVPVP